MDAKAALAKRSPLADVFDELKAVLAAHASGLAVRTGMVKNQRDYQLYSEKSVVIDGRKEDGIYFAGPNPAEELRRFLLLSGLLLRGCESQALA